VYYGFGIHPWWAGAYDPATDAGATALAAAIARLRELLTAHPGASVGEIGLDKCARGLAAAPLAVQTAVFDAMLAVAADARRAVSVHCVRAHEETVSALVAALARRPGAGGGGGRLAGILMHSWAGPPSATARLTAAAAAARVQLAFSFQGAIVRAVAAACDGAECGAAAGGASRQTLSVLAQLPPGAVVFETDAPYQPFGDPRADSAWAALRSGTLAALAAAGASSGGGSSSSGAAAAAAIEVPDATSPPAQTPARVLEVLLAAAAWRAMKARSGGGGGGSRLPDATAVASEASLLAAAAVQSLDAIFGPPPPSP